MRRTAKAKIFGGQVIDLVGMSRRRNQPTLVGTAVGVILLGTSVALFWLLTSDDDADNLASVAGDSAGATTAATTTLTTTTTTSATTTTTTSATTTTTTSATTVPETTTTVEESVDPSIYSTETKTAAATGDPGSLLTDVRTGFHNTFSRIVWDFAGDGTPAYHVGYQPGPTFSNTADIDPIAPAGAAFLVVTSNPARTFDIENSSPTYLGPLSFDPDIGPIAEIAFIDDFEAVMVWVIGLTDQRDFKVETRLDPSRLVVDIKN